jgi:cytochrome b561
MAAKATAVAYSPASKLIHWLTALCVLAVIPMGIAMMWLPEGDLQDKLFDLHRSFGVLVFALALLRIAARSLLGVPAPLASITPFERRASVGAHHALIALSTAMPLIGWLMMSAYRADVPVFGLFTLPHLMPQNDTVYEVLSRVHQVLGFLMAAIIVAHAGGALMHAAIKRDGVLQRMLPVQLADWLSRLQGGGGAA